jgi:hypothetical protein
MAAREGQGARAQARLNMPSEEFAAYCEAEFERRLNSGDDFDESRYRRAMDMVLDRLRRLEDGARA